MASASWSVISWFGEPVVTDGRALLSAWDNLSGVACLAAGTAARAHAAGSSRVWRQCPERAGGSLPLLAASQQCPYGLGVCWRGSLNCWVRDSEELHVRWVVEHPRLDWGSWSVLAPSPGSGSSSNGKLSKVWLKSHRAVLFRLIGSFCH